MCGIAGFLGGYDPAHIDAMAMAIAHRGPDDVGIYRDAEAGLALAHRRLAIIDLSPAGHQPMIDASARFVMVYNGEVYNHRKLRRDLEARGARFRGHSDSEVILEGFARDGVASLARLNGIFALAIWDREARALTLIRDGLGVKPLYVLETATGIAFASEIKALTTLDPDERTLDPVAIAAYLSYLWSPGERTMLARVRKLDPGTWLRIGPDGTQTRDRFYTLPAYAPVERSDADHIAGTREVLARAVERQLLADVEVGAFLSGGLDSSAIVALALRSSGSRTMPCFTIDYSGSEQEELIDDLPYARRAAAALGVDLAEIRVDASLADRFGEMIATLDEPQADPAALNSLAIAGLARQNGIKVLLSGTGGDDVFTGYRRHQAIAHDRIWDRVPAPLRRMIATASRHIPDAMPQARRVRKVLGGIAGTSDERIARTFEWLDVPGALALLSPELRGAAGAVRAPLMATLAAAAGTPAVERALRIDQRYFLTDHNLNYTDKTGMAAGVEIRVPFLDPDLMAWAATLPIDVKLRGGETKWVLRKAMEPFLPHDIIYRPKTGFGVPLRAWMRGVLADMRAELLAPRVLRDRGIFDVQRVVALEQATLAGRIDGSYTLLAVMAIELWCRAYIDAAPSPSLSAASINRSIIANAS